MSPIGDEGLIVAFSACSFFEASAKMCGSAQQYLKEALDPDSPNGPCQFSKLGFDVRDGGIGLWCLHAEAGNADLGPNGFRQDTRSFAVQQKGTIRCKQSLQPVQMGMEGFRKFRMQQKNIAKIFESHDFIEKDVSAAKAFAMMHTGLQIGMGFAHEFLLGFLDGEAKQADTMGIL
jgi:hypothetical protein